LVFREDGEHVDALARAHEVDLGLLAGLGCAAELQDRRHVDGVTICSKLMAGRMLHAGVGGADGGVEVIGGLLIGGVGLLHLAGGWRGGSSASAGKSGAGGAGGSGSAVLGDLNSSGGGGADGAAELHSTPGIRAPGWIGIGARGSVGGELAAVGDDEGLVLFGHVNTLSVVRIRMVKSAWCLDADNRLGKQTTTKCGILPLHCFQGQNDNHFSEAFSNA